MSETTERDTQELHDLGEALLEEAPVNCTSPDQGFPAVVAFINGPTKETLGPAQNHLTRCPNCRVALVMHIHTDNELTRLGLEERMKKIRLGLEEHKTKLRIISWGLVLLGVYVVLSDIGHLLN